MSRVQESPLVEIGQKLWLVDFMVSYIGNTGADFEGGDDATNQKWEDALFENYKLLKDAVAELKMAVLLLQPEMAGKIAAAYHQENEDSKARGAASCLLASIQREISENKGGAA